MNDLVLAIGWTLILGGALCICVILRRAGVPATYVRDLLHVGTGAWVLGWPLWRTAIVPTAITALALIGVACVPVAAARFPSLRRIEDALAVGDERWSGVTLYVASYTLLTGVGLACTRLAAAAGLLALSLGDGVVGLVGRRFGRLRYAVPGGKQKTLEGTLAVAAMASIGALVASHVVHAPLGAAGVVGVGVVAALAEALAPRGTDNLAVPLGVWAFLLLTDGA